jgi:splicing suppressor protein 51
VAAVQDLRVAHELTGTSRPIALRTMHARTSYIAPSSLSDWADYHERVFPDFATGVQLFARQFQGNHSDAEHAAGTIFIDSTSMVLTLLAAMEHTIPNLQMRSKLCIHIVAAAHKEFNTQDMMEELLHYLPKLETVVIVYIGPTLPTVSTASQNHACYGCRQSRRRRTVILCPITYHEFAESAKYRANPPDLVAGFNTGMGEVGVSGWEKSMRVVLESNVPAVFTTYTVFEALNDTNMLTELGASFVKTLEKNLWRGVIPLIAERIEVHGLDHFSNNYWFIVRGRL